MYLFIAYLTDSHDSDKTQKSTNTVVSIVCCPPSSFSRPPDQSKTGFEIHILS